MIWPETEIGSRVRIHYRAKRRRKSDLPPPAGWMPWEGHHGVVVCIAKPRRGRLPGYHGTVKSPRNVMVRLDAGPVIVFPFGNVVLERKDG